MKFSLWTEYGALNSRPIFNAFKQGASALGFTCVENSQEADVDVIWSVLFHGRMARNKEIWQKNKASGKPTIVLEVGGINRGTTWKVGLNGINRDAYFGPNNNDDARVLSLGLTLKPWRTSGEFILLCGQHDKSAQWQHMMPMAKWVRKTINGIQKHSDRPILFRPHPRCPLPHIEHEYKNVIRQTPAKLPGSYDDFDMSYDRIHATVSWSSNPGIHSVLNGVPAFVGPSSLAYDVSIKSLTTIDTPILVDRQQWLNDYAHTEWTVDEISQGIPLKRLTGKL